MNWVIFCPKTNVPLFSMWVLVPAGFSQLPCAWGYENLFGADFGIENKAYVKAWAPDAIQLSEIRSDIGSFLADKPETYDFIHMSHVIEHIPKYSLLWVVDALYRALKPGGVLMLRTPNMEGPCANSSFYITLAHEYGFSSGNLASLLDICGFDEIRFHLPSAHDPSLKQRLGRLIRWPFLKESEIRHRLFGVNEPGRFDSELIVTEGATSHLFLTPSIAEISDKRRRAV